MDIREGATELTDLQFTLMRSLWTRGEATVAQVHEDLSKTRKLATSTVATLLSRLEKRGMVTRRAVDRLFLYHALVDEPTVRRTMVATLRDRLFAGDVVAFVGHLLNEQPTSSEEKRRVRELLA